MIAFAANSVLCRIALKHTALDPMSFTLIRLVSGAAMLWLILQFRDRALQPTGSWSGALSLTLYAFAFSYAYVNLDTGTGALLLFGAVQLAMFGYGYVKGERMKSIGIAGLLLAIVGIVGLLLPGASAPPLSSAMVMLLSGIAWAAYTLIGKLSSDPLRSTTGNFLRAVPIIVLVSIPFLSQLSFDGYGLVLAIASGTLASGVGYTIWYAAMGSLTSFRAATVQLSVPVLASLAGVVLLDETLTWRLAITSLAVLGGIALVLSDRSSKSSLPKTN
jgi:drug/metabolite transporter (DMT)-like permease